MSSLKERMQDFQPSYTIRKKAPAAPATDARQWIREVLKLEPSGALACSGVKSRKAFEFPTDKALKDYLHEHPEADRKHHWVKKSKPSAPAQKAPAAPSPATGSKAVEKKFGVHKVFDAQHPVSEHVQRFRAIIGNPDPSNPWQVKDKDAIRNYLSKKLGQKPKYDDLKREVQQRTKAAEVISYGFWSATKHTDDPTFKMDMVTNRKGVPQGMVTSYENSDHELEIGALASSGQVRGMGTYLIARTIKQQLKEGEKLTLSALDTAKPFYRKIGMKPVDPIGPMFYFEHDDAVKFADRVFAELGAGKVASLMVAVSLLPNDVTENGYPQEYMSPSPAEVGSVRPGDDKLLTGRIAERIAADVMALHEKKHYRYDPGHRRKPGPGWTPSEAGWTKPRPTQLQQVVTQGDAQPQAAPQVVARSESRRSR